MSQENNTKKTTLSLAKKKPTSTTNRSSTVKSKNGEAKKEFAGQKSSESKGRKPAGKETSSKKSFGKKTGGSKPSAHKPFAHKQSGQNKNRGQKNGIQKKSGLHPRNQHNGRYDLVALAKALPELADHIIKNPVGESTVNFSDPVAVKMLNKALLAHHYGVQHWDIPAGYLCPPIPGRADYIHRVADLLNDECEDNTYNHKAVVALDIGVGANCIYPIVGATEYGWKYKGSDIDPVSIKAANFIAEVNPVLKGKIRCKLQNNVEHMFKGIIGDNERYDVTTCNPPFHQSLEEAQQGAQRKLDNLAANRNKKQGIDTRNAKGKPNKNQEKPQPALNFGGQKSELWCDGGEAAFVDKLAKESKLFATQVLWFTTLLSKKENLPKLQSTLGQLDAKQVKIVEMSQGQKVSRFVAWTFMDKAQRSEWIELK
ncbi:23S rRNA (adenine(1618)-N(6))-methyltransferase RlmF [Vibrio makurazakiensis]|uniref:23S rRNA (adenine(1618)-N(6))-methyltransferase RlmF n=1 Tax=Vibrio makurazakiensis TaxID=2910250 RepID=UPI003D0B09F7